VNVLKYLGETDALLFGDVLFVCHVITVVFSTSSSASEQALLTPRLLDQHPVRHVVKIHDRRVEKRKYAKQLETSSIENK